MCWNKCYSKPVLVLMHQVHKRTSSQQLRGKGSSKERESWAPAKWKSFHNGREKVICGNNLGHSTRKTRGWGSKIAHKALLLQAEPPTTCCDGIVLPRSASAQRVMQCSTVDSTLKLQTNTHHLTTIWAPNPLQPSYRTPSDGPWWHYSVRGNISTELLAIDL